jgi:hypothetical protein
LTTVDKLAIAPCALASAVSSVVIRASKVLKCASTVVVRDARAPELSTIVVAIAVTLAEAEFAVWIALVASWWELTASTKSFTAASSSDEVSCVSGSKAVPWIVY